MNNFEQFIKKAKSINLSRDEKAVARQSVLNLISNNSVRTETEPRLSNWSTMFNYKLNYVSIMTILLIITLMFGGGIGLAAEKALPGDSLYPVKIGFNEEVRGWLSISEEAKANWEVERVQKRLEEAELMASQGSLDAESRAVIEANFQAQSDRVKARIAKFEGKDNFNAVVGVSSNFEVTLKAHERILARLLDEETDAVLKVEIGPIKVRVGSEAISAKKSREDSEDKISAKVRVDIQSAAGGKLKAAENKIEEVEKFIKNIESKLGAEGTVQAKARLTLANQTVVEGRAKLESKLYGDAFILFQKAIRIAQEAKLLVQARRELKIDVQINGHRTASGSMEVDGKDNNNDEDDDDQVEVRSETEINDGSLKGRGKLKIDVGL